MSFHSKFFLFLLVFLSFSVSAQAACSSAGNWPGGKDCLPALKQKKNFLSPDMGAQGYGGIPQWDNKKNLLSTKGDTLKAPSDYPDAGGAQ